MAKIPMKRYRLSIPEADVTVSDWSAAQSNFSASVRRLINDYVERYGYTDATCQRKEQLPRRGRPPKDAINPMTDSVTYIENETTDDVLVNMEREREVVAAMEQQLLLEEQRLQKERDEIKRKQEALLQQKSAASPLINNPPINNVGINNPAADDLLYSLDQLK